MTTMSRRPRAIVAAISADIGSACALTRAHVLSNAFQASLHVVKLLRIDEGPVFVRESTVRAEVIRWAHEAAGIVLSTVPIAIAIGDPFPMIRDVALRAEADLVVVGRDGTSVIDSLVAWASRSILVAGRAGDPKEIVAATDLRDHRFPVVRSASRLATLTRSHVTVVHNMEHVEGERMIGAADVLERSRVLERIAYDNRAVYGARIATRKTPEAIVDIADNQDADMLVVGFRRRHGTTLSGVLHRSGRSVLALPLPEPP